MKRFLIHCHHYLCLALKMGCGRVFLSIGDQKAKWRKYHVYEVTLYADRKTDDLRKTGESYILDKEAKVYNRIHRNRVEVQHSEKK